MLQPSLYDSLADSLGRDPKEACHLWHRKHSFIGHAVQPSLLSPKLSGPSDIIRNRGKRNKRDNFVKLQIQASNAGCPYRHRMPSPGRY